MGGTAVMPAVVSFLSTHPNEPSSLDQISLATGIESGRIQKAISNALRDGMYGDAIECVHRGQVWIWRGQGRAQFPGTPSQVAQALPARNRPAPAPVVVPALARGDMVEVIGLDQAGDAVARDDAGKLYRVVPL